MCFALIHALSSNFFLCFRLPLLFACSFCHLRPQLLGSLASLSPYKVKCSMPFLSWYSLRTENQLTHVKCCTRSWCTVAIMKLSAFLPCYWRIIAISKSLVNEQGLRFLRSPDHLMPNTRNNDVQFISKTELSAAFPKATVTFSMPSAPQRAGKCGTMYMWSRHLWLFAVTPRGQADNPGG